MWLPAAFLAATLSLPLALACRPCLRKALNVVGRFLSPETVRELAGKEAQLAAARASEARLRGLLQSSDDKLKSRASTLQGIEGRLEERERSLVYYRKRESLLESACEVSVRTKARRASFQLLSGARRA